MGEIAVTERELQKQVQAGYQKINSRWIRLHLHLLMMCTGVSVTIEIVMLFVMNRVSSVDCGIPVYILKYIGIPFAMGICFVVMGYAIIKRKKVSMEIQQYAISLLFTGYIFTLSLVHSGFVAIIAAAIFPILMTLMYEDPRLTTVIAVTNTLFAYVSGKITFWDPSKNADETYYMNLLILLAIILSMWLTCHVMIKFMKMKRELIVKNDVERYQLQRQVNTDGLTNVGNKKALENCLAAIKGKCKEQCCLMMLDVDHFKMINDTYGHLFGDEALRCLGEGLQNTCQHSNAQAFRYGGDEFCVVFFGETMETVYCEAECIQGYVKSHLEVPQHGKNICLSIGIADYENNQTAEGPLQQADMAMYDAKKKGGNRITIYKR
ncbi:MAG: GGDEF domain-containing protein [Lachnospiraceae bacterium]